MSDENKDPLVDQKKSTEKQLNEEELNKVSGGTSRSDGGGATVGRAN